MYYLKSRYYDPELRRFISSDEMSTTCISVETYHNKNLYIYCNENPLTRRDEGGELWGQIIFGAVCGFTLSIGTQLVSTGTVNWKELGRDTISGAIEEIMTPRVKVVVGVVTAVYQSYKKDEDGGTVIWSAITGALSSVDILPDKMFKNFQDYILGRKIITELRIPVKLKEDDLAILNKIYAREATKDVVKRGINEIYSNKVASIEKPNFAPFIPVNYAPFIPVNSPNFVQHPNLVDMIPVSKTKRYR